MAKTGKNNGDKSKRVTRYTYESVMEPRTPETGHTALLPADEQVVTVPMDNGWSKAMKISQLPAGDQRTVVMDMDPAADPTLFWSGNPVAEVTVRPVVGGNPEAVLTLDEFRKEWPLLRTSFLLAEELYEATNPGSAADLGIGPTFDELLEVTQEYVQTRVTHPANGDKRDIGIYHWRLQARDLLENAIRGAESGGAESIPILATPEWLDSGLLKRFQWTGILADGKKAHTNKVPCHTDLEKKFADFLDGAKDVLRYLKNERFAFSVTYYEQNRPRQFYPDFIVAVREKDGSETMWLAETKGEMRINVPLKNGAAALWCEKMSTTRYGQWRYLFAQQLKLEKALGKGVATFAALASILAE